MASEASWQTSGAGRGSDAFTTEQPMDQRTVESLLRRLVERVEESERRYGEALDELHARLDQLSHTTEAARDTSTPQDIETFDRLHSQVSDLARRFEHDTETPLDDFERLGKALTGALGHGVSGMEDMPEEEPFGEDPEPSPFARAAMAAKFAPDETAAWSFPNFTYPELGTNHLAPASEFKCLDSMDADLDKRLVEMAHRLEQSIGTAMPTNAIEALNARLDEIGSQLNETLAKAPTKESLAYVEQQISDINQQLGRAEAQLGKISGVEDHLLELIQRLDEKSAEPAPTQPAPAQLEEIASNAAAEAARLVAVEAKQNGERLDAMQRHLTAMNDKSRESGDRLVSTLEAVHESLKHLVQQVERGAPAFQAKPRAPFAERPQAAAPQAQAATPGQPAAAAPQAKPAMPNLAGVRIDKQPTPPKTDEGTADSPKDRALRDRLGAVIPDFKEAETPPPFGRAKRAMPDDEAVDLDAAAPPRRAKTALRPDAEAKTQAGLGLGEDMEAPDDLVAAARRAAQAAALRAEERGGRRASGHFAGSAPGIEQPGRRKRSLLIIAAAVLLALSAALLYGRLRSKPEAEVAPPGVEQTLPAPADSTEGTPGTGESAPTEAPEKSGSWEPLPDTGAGSRDSAGQPRR